MSLRARVVRSGHRSGARVDLPLHGLSDPDRLAVCLTGDEPAVYVKTGDNGGRRVQHFCSTCGSPVFTCGDGESGGEWGIRWGSIRERAALKPARQIWCRSAVPWLGEIAELPGRAAD
jgi:hypothetical protein